MNRFLTAIVLVAVVAVGSLAADFSAVLQQVAGYDYGNSRESLTTLSDILRKAANDKAQMAEYEKAMLKVLVDKNTSFAARQYLCKELSIMGTDASVPTLAKMLRKSETADIARYALERIPGAVVDAELIKAISKTKGTVKIGVINSVGNRRIAAATAVLKNALKDKNAAIAGAAAAALGKIGTAETATILGEALVAAEGSLRADIVDAYLQNAAHFVQAGEKNNAQSIYQMLFMETETLPTRTAALTGLVHTLDDPSAFIVDVLENPNMDGRLKAAAISLVNQCKRPLDVAAIAAVLPKLSTIARVQLLTALGERGDVAAHDQVVAAVADENNDVSITAIEALSVLGNKKDVLLLAETAANSRGDKQQAARASLALLNADGVDDMVLALLPQAEGAVKIELVQAIGKRQLKTAVPTLLAAAKNDNARVRVAAIRSLGLVAGETDMDALVDLLINTRGNAERREAERTVATVAARIEDESARGASLLAALPGVTDMKAKSSLLLVLGRIGVADALPMLKQGLASDDPELKRAAILSLSEWPTPQPAKDLLAIAKSAAEPSHRVLALRGYIRLAGLESDRPKAETVAMYKTALDMAENIGEKRMALSGLARVENLDALLLAGQYLDDPELYGEAEIAVMDNAWQTRNVKTGERKAILQKVYEKTTDDENRRDAKRLLDEYKQ